MSKGLLIIIIYALLALVAIANFPAPAGAEEEQNIAEIKAQIQEYENKLMYEQAISLYDDLIDDYPKNKVLSDEYIAFCEKYDYQGYVQDECERRLVADENDKEIALKLLDAYHKQGSRDIYTFMDENKELLSDTELYISIQQENKSNFRHVGTVHKDVSEWSAQGYTYTIDRDDDSVVYSSGAGALLSTSSEILSYSSDQNYIAIKDNDQLVYVNSRGDRQLVPYNSETKELIYLEYAGPYSEGYANVKKDSLWGYMTPDLRYGYVKYQHTTPFSDHVSAAKDENGWAILNNSFQPIGDQYFEDIYMDEYGYCCFDGIIFAKANGGWQMYSVEYTETEDDGTTITNATSLKLCSDAVYKDVKPFGEYGAVKQGGKWGFVKTDGSWLIEPAYSDAYSFRCGLAPVLIEDKWGYISEDGEIIIEPTYDGAISFSNNGVSAVKTEETWRFIQLIEYYYIGR